MSTRPWTTAPRFLSNGGRRLFALDILPTGPCRGSLLYLPPFAEEMNRLRCHAAAQARALAAQGWRTLLLDPTATGESEGLAAEAGWDRWCDDAAAAASLLQRESGHAPVLWGVRTGALLAAEIAARGAAPASGLLFWQPAVDGKLFVTQYLRLRIASQVVAEGDRETTELLMQRLRAGEVIEVAGYPLSGDLAEALSTLRLGTLLAGSTLPIRWLEVVAQADQPLSPASRKLVDTLAADRFVKACTAQAPAVWQLAKRVDAPGLMAATLELMREDA